MHIMQCHYNVNVARRVTDTSRREGFRREHFFRVLVEDPERARQVFRELMIRFPDLDGYEISVTEWTGSGHELDIVRFLKGKE